MAADSCGTKDRIYPSTDMKNNLLETAIFQKIHKSMQYSSA